MSRPARSRHRERTHREAEVVEHAVDLRRCRALEDDLVGLETAGVEDAVADEAAADADQDRDLADLAGERHRGGDHVLRGLLAAHRLQQAHHVGRAEEVEADHVLGPLGDAADLVDVERRGVGGEDRARLADRVELPEDVLLELHVLEHRLDHDVLVGERAHVERALQQVHAGVDVLRLDAAALRGALVVLAHHRRDPSRGDPCRASTTVTGMPALAKFMAMPPPMVPQPRTPTRSILRSGVSAGTSGIFAASRSEKK